MQKRRLLLITSGVFGIIMLLFLGMFIWVNKTKIGQKVKKENAVIELELWYPWSKENEIYQKAIQEAIEEFHEEQNYIRICSEGVDTEVYREKLPSAVAMDETPDMYFCYTSTYLQNIVQTGKVLSMNNYLPPDVKEQLQKGAFETVTFQNQIYGLPFAEDMGVFLVNTELFDKYELQIPETWEELLAVCKVFIEKGMTPLACATDMDTGYRMYLEILCLSESGKETCKRIISRKEMPDQAFSNGVYKFCKLLEIGAFGERDIQKSTFDIEDEFMMSRIPMYFTKNHMLGNIMQKNNPLYGKIKLVSFPDSHGKVLGGVSEAFVVDSSTQYPQEAVYALGRILQKFSTKLYEKGAALPVWDTSNAKVPEEELYRSLISELQHVQEKMLYWEFLLDAHMAVRFMEESEKLFLGKIDEDNFLGSFLENGELFLLK